MYTSSLNGVVNYVGQTNNFARRAAEWAKGLNRVDFGDMPLTLGGGEPTLHPEFFGLLENLRPDIKVDLLTNLQFDIGDFMRRTSPARFNSSDNPAYRSIRVSFHPQRMDPFDLTERVAQMQKEGYSIGIFGLNHPDSIKANMLMSELARSEQVYFFVKDFLGSHDGHLHGHYRYPDAINSQRQQVDCRTRDILIAPNGDIHRCHRDLYKVEKAVGNITDRGLTIDYKFRPCKNFGDCNPCDVKLRTNRFLQTGDCNVEVIKDE